MTATAIRNPCAIQLLQTSFEFLDTTVSLETRQAILGHKSRSITTHYSAAELRELLNAMEFIATDNLRESHALTLLKRKTG